MEQRGPHEVFFSKESGRNTLDKSDLCISGLAYRSRVKVVSNGDITLSNIAPSLQQLFGGAEFSTGISSPSTFPDITSLEAAYRPLKELTPCH